MRRGKYTKETKIDGKVVVITGANCGIGKETAVDLAKRGGKIYIACRDIKRGEDALKEIKEISGSNNVHFLQLDLASLDSVREFSRKFHELENQLHILINNAGIMACPQSKTTDGFELQLGTNHLGHFLLTNLLLDLIKSSSPSRIVVVSSEAYVMGNISRDDLMCENSYGEWKAYGQSKLANILFSNELASKLEGTGVTVNSLHPGVVRTELGRHGSQTIKKFIIDPIFSHFMKTAWEGAQTSIYLALDPDLNEVTGKYFLNCKEDKPWAKARDKETAAWLLNKSMELVKL